MTTVSGTALLLRSLPVWFSPIASALRASGRPAASRAETKILLIDSNDSVRELLSLYLGEKGMEVATVRSAAEARALVTRGQFDLVILDWRLEGTEGLGLLNLCKTRQPAIPVIIFSSADPGREADEGGMVTKADAVVRRNGSLDALFQAISRCLGQHRVQSRNAA